MEYQVLARKWRPKKFEDVVGQKHILTAIKNSVILKKVHHAYILFGTRGVGKTTIARLFAKILNCTVDIESRPCGICKVCLEIDRGCFLDVIEIDAASRTKVEDTREFLDNVYYIPNIGKFKIYLIDEVHMLSRNSLNALLKILEEPPVHVKFFLITTEEKKLPSTILSRCVQFYLRPLSYLQIYDQLVHIFKNENIYAESAAIKLIVSFAKGSMRDALSLSEHAMAVGKNRISYNILTEILGIIDIEHSLYLLEHLIIFDIKSVMARIAQCEKLNVNWDYVLSDMLSLLQKIALIQLSSQNEDEYDDIGNDITRKKSRLYILSKKIIPADVQSYYQIFLSGRKELFYAPSYRTGFEMIMLRTSILLNSSKNINSQLVFNDNIDHSTYIANVITNQGAFVSPISTEQDNILFKKKK